MVVKRAHLPARYFFLNEHLFRAKKFFQEKIFSGLNYSKSPPTTITPTTTSSSLEGKRDKKKKCRCKTLKDYPLELHIHVRMSGSVNPLNRTCLLVLTRIPPLCKKNGGRREVAGGAGRVCQGFVEDAVVRSSGGFGGLRNPRHQCILHQ